MGSHRTERQRTNRSGRAAQGPWPGTADPGRAPAPVAPHGVRLTPVDGRLEHVRAVSAELGRSRARPRPRASGLRRAPDRQGGAIDLVRADRAAAVPRPLTARATLRALP